MQQFPEQTIKYNNMPARTAVGRSQKTRMHLANDSISSLKPIQEAPVKYNNVPVQTAVSQKNEMNLANDSVSSLKASIANFHQSQNGGMNLANDSVSSLKASIANFHQSQNGGMNLANDSVSSLKASIANFHQSQKNEMNLANDSISSLRAGIANFHESQSSTPVPKPLNGSPIPTRIDTKHVRFDKHITKHYGLSKKDMPTDEREKYWYTKTDDRKVFMNAKLTVRMIMKGMPFDDVENCARGLECKTQSESKKRVRNKKKATAALLSEQERQRLQGAKNPERLARAVQKYTKELADLATELAIQDEKDVQEYLIDTRNDLQSLSSPKSPASSE